MKLSFLVEGVILFIFSLLASLVGQIEYSLLFGIMTILCFGFFAILRKLEEKNG
jgi:positive regulator of sigma E activity